MKLDQYRNTFKCDNCGEVFEPFSAGRTWSIDSQDGKVVSLSFCSKRCMNLYRRSDVETTVRRFLVAVCALALTTVTIAGLLTLGRIIFGGPKP